jgi:hypothetical protein
LTLQGTDRDARGTWVIGDHGPDPRDVPNPPTLRLDPRVLKGVRLGRAIECRSKPNTGLGLDADVIDPGRSAASSVSKTVATHCAHSIEEKVMNMLRHIRPCFLSCSALAIVLPTQGLAQQNSNPSSPSPGRAPAAHDGQHDFDPLIGTWKYHLSRRLHPLTGSTTWIEFDGAGVCRKIWDGADLDEFKVDSPTDHIEGLTLRLYNPESHQWSLYWANRKNGTLVPPQIGEYKNGRGEFFAQDTFNGRVILIRFVWSDMTTNSPHFEQSFSDDGGKTWEVNWITNQTRVKDESDKAH